MCMVTLVKVITGGLGFSEYCYSGCRSNRVKVGYSVLDSNDSTGCRDNG